MVATDQKQQASEISSTPLFSMSEDKLIRCSTVQGLPIYLEKKIGQELLRERLAAVNLPYDYLTDPENWITGQQHEALLSLFVEYTGGGEAFFEAASYVLRKEVTGSNWFLIMTNLGSPKQAYKKLTDDLVVQLKSVKWEIVELTDSKFVVKSTWVSGISFSPEACLFCWAVLATVPTLWGNPVAEFTERQCQTEGYDHCIVEFNWKNRPAHPATIGLTLASGALLTIFDAGSLYLSLCLVVIVALIGFTIDSRRRWAFQCDVAQGQQQELSKAITKLNDKYSELNTMHDELNLAYQSLYEAKKLEPLKALAGGIAHDYNNALTGIEGFLDFSLHSLNDGVDRKVIVEHIKNADLAIQQAKSLTNQLKVFSKEGTPIKEVASMEQLLIENVNFSLTGSKVKCRFEIEPKLRAAHVDINQLGQVIGNLTLNAVQAMPEGGEIVVSANNLTVDNEHLQKYQDIAAGEYLFITFKDHGVGIPESDIDKIFDLYFTTKKSGSGLGLTSSKSIIENHAGYMFVESKEGEGATFYLYIPSSDETPVESLEIDSAALFSEGRILVMDDDPNIQRLLNSVIPYIGCEVEVVDNGNETIKKYREAIEQNNPFDAVILDLTIPGGIGGKEVVLLLKEIDPKVKAIVTSGYHSEPIIANYQDYGFTAALRKPYKMKDISGVIYDVLSQE